MARIKSVNLDISRVLIKPKKYVVLVCLLSSTFHSTIVSANEIKNQNLNNPSGTTIHSNNQPCLVPE